MKKIISLLAVLMLIFSCTMLGIGTVAFAAEESDEGDFLVFDGVLEEYVGDGGDIVIPASLGVKEIAANAFQNNADVTSVVFPEGVETIGYWSFRGCENIESITFPYSLCELAEHCFSSAAITEITIPGNVEIVGYGAFSSCKYLEKVTISYGVKEIMVLSFSGCGVKNVVLPETVEILCGGSFTNNKNPSVSKSEITICNPDCEVGGWVKDSSKDAYKHSWHGYATPVSNNASGTQYIFYVPRDSEVHKALEENLEKWLEADRAAGGSSVGGGTDRVEIRPKDQEYFDALPENQEGYGTQKPANSGSGSTNKGENNPSDTEEGSDTVTNNQNNNTNNSSNNGNSNGTQTVIEQGSDNTVLIIVVAVIGGIILLAIIVVVILAATGVLFGKGKKTAKSEEEIIAEYVKKQEMLSEEKEKLRAEILAEMAQTEEKPEE